MSLHGALIQAQQKNWTQNLIKGFHSKQESTLLPKERSSLLADIDTSVKSKVSNRDEVPNTGAKEQYELQCKASAHLNFQTCLEGK